MSTIDDISASELASRLDDGEETIHLLDVRREDEYEEWHIEGTHNLPLYDELLDEDFTGLESSLEKIPEDKENIIVCVGGITSSRAAEFLKERGYDAKSVEGGMRGWGRVHRTYTIPEIEGLIQIVRPGTGCISYLVHDGDESVVVDPSLYIDEYRAVADEINVGIVGAIDTHAHADHLSGGRRLAEELDSPYFLHPNDAGEFNEEEYTAIDEGDTISIGTDEMEVHHTPGHTPGSISLLWNDALLSGDTVFLRSVGRPDLEGSDETDVREASEELFTSLRRVAELPDETIVLPGHFSDEEMRPLATPLGDLNGENELFDMRSGEAFTDTIIESLSDEPANYNRIKAINWGLESLDEEAEDLELGPNNCAAN